MDELLFRETQHMAEGPTPFVVIIAFAAFFTYIGYQYRIWKKFKVLSVLVVSFALLITVIVATLRLDTLYYKDRVEYQFISVYSAKYEMLYLDTIKSIEVISYNPVSDFGGWGVRTGTDTRVYNVSGNTGVLFTSKNGSKLLLGTSQPEALLRHLKDHYPLVSQ